MWSPELVRWPVERRRREQLAARGIPRLLVVAEGAEVPTDLGDDEDWVRLPASEQDVAARLHNLGTRVRAGISLDDRVLRTSLGTVTLTEREATVVATLLEHRGAPVPRDVVAASLGAPAPSGRAVQDVASRLRRRLRPLGLDVFSARGRGYTLGWRIDETLRQ